MGDMNAKVGPISHSNIVGNFGLGEKNDRGERLIQFCEQNQLMKQVPGFSNHHKTFTHGKVHLILQEIKLTT